jgi:hypothetical protein
MGLRAEFSSSLVWNLMSGSSSQGTESDYIFRFSPFHYQNDHLNQQIFCTDQASVFFLGATAPIWALAYLHETLCFTFSRFQTVSRTPWACDQLVARPLPVRKHRKTHARTHTKHPCPEWSSNPRSRLPRERRQCMP